MYPIWKRHERIILLSVIALLLVAFAYELAYIESLLSNPTMSADLSCRRQCEPLGKAHFADSNGNCYCKDHVTLAATPVCFHNITFNDSWAYSQKFSPSVMRDVAASSTTKYDATNTYANRVFSIFDVAAHRLRYVSDPRQDEYVADPTETWSVQAGDCDDMAVLLSSMYESIGLDASIVEAYKPAYGHVFVIVRVDQPLSLFLQKYTWFVDKYTRYSGQSPFHYLLMEDDQASCDSLVSRLQSGGDADHFYMIVDTYPDGYAGLFNPFQEYDSFRFYNIGY